MKNSLYEKQKFSLPKGNLLKNGKKKDKKFIEEMKQRHAIYYQGDKKI